MARVQGLMSRGSGLRDGRIQSAQIKASEIKLVIFGKPLAALKPN